MMAKKTFWYKEFNCPVCEQEFEAVRVFSNAVSIDKRDLYLRPTYKGVDPDKFYLITCPYCYYTAFESDFDNLPGNLSLDKLNSLKKSLERAMKSLNPELGEERTARDAHEINVLGVLTYVHADIPYKLAQIFLRMSWFYIDQGDKENAAISMSKALKQFQRAFEDDKKGLHTDGIIFFLAALNIQLNHIKEGFRWLEKLLKEYRGTGSHYEKAGKTLWEEVRESKLM